MAESESLSRQEGHEVAKEMNLKTNPTATLEAMGEVEGNFWLRSEREMMAAKKVRQEYPSTVRYALGRLAKEEASPFPLDRRQGQAAETEANEALAEIYGAGGGNRWRVYSDGRVEFDRSYCADEKILAQVEKLGFKICY